MAVYLVVLLSALTSISLRGSKVAVSLYALELGASAAAVGVLAALFALFPLFLAVPAGRLSDRFGVRLPIVCGTLIMAAGLALPLAMPGMAALFLCPAAVGLGHVFFHVSAHSLVGALGTAGGAHAQLRHVLARHLDRRFHRALGRRLRHRARRLPHGFRPARRRRRPAGALRHGSPQRSFPSARATKAKRRRKAPSTCSPSRPCAVRSS